MEMPANTPTLLRERATRFRNMCRVVTDEPTLDALTELAADYEAVADRWEQVNLANTVIPAGRRQEDVTISEAGPLRGTPVEDPPTP